MSYDAAIVQRAAARLARRKEIRSRRRWELEQELYRRQPCLGVLFQQSQQSGVIGRVQFGFPPLVCSSIKTPGRGDSSHQGTKKSPLAPETGAGDDGLCKDQYCKMSFTVPDMENSLAEMWSRYTMPSFSPLSSL